MFTFNYMIFSVLMLSTCHQEVQLACKISAAIVSRDSPGRVT